MRQRLGPRRRQTEDQNPRTARPAPPARSGGCPDRGRACRRRSRPPGLRDRSAGPARHPGAAASARPAAAAAARRYPAAGRTRSAPHPLHVRVAELAERSDLRRYQQGLRGGEISRRVLRLGRRQRREARSPGSGVSATARPQNAADAATPPRRRARSAELMSSAATPSSGPAVACARCQARRSGSTPGISHRGECGMGGSPVRNRGRPVDGRTHQRMPEPHVHAELQQASLRGSVDARGVQAEDVGGPEDQGRVPDRIGGCEQDQPLIPGRAAHRGVRGTGPRCDGADLPRPGARTRRPGRLLPGRGRARAGRADGRVSPR